MHHEFRKSELSKQEAGWEPPKTWLWPPPWIWSRQIFHWNSAAGRFVKLSVNSAKLLLPQTLLRTVRHSQHGRLPFAEGAVSKCELRDLCPCKVLTQVPGLELLCIPSQGTRHKIQSQTFDGDNQLSWTFLRTCGDKRMSQ